MSMGGPQAHAKLLPWDYVRFARHPPAIGGKRRWKSQLLTGVVLGSQEISLVRVAHEMDK
jgi:hypothetical protein